MVIAESSLMKLLVLTLNPYDEDFAMDILGVWNNYSNNSESWTFHTTLILYFWMQPLTSTGIYASIYILQTQPDQH